MDNFLKTSLKGKGLSQQYRTMLETGAWFNSLPEDFKCALLARAEVKHFPANQYLFSRGEAFNGVYCLLKGTLHVNNQNPDGKQILLAVLEPNSWFGEAAIIDGHGRQCNAVTHTACSVLWLAPELLHGVLDAEPSRWRYIAALLAERMRWAHTRIEETTLMTAIQRVANRLLVMTENYQGLTCTGRCLLSIPQDHLASMLALSRQTINQVLKQLEARNIIRIHYREIEIINIEALHKISRYLF